MTKAKAPAKKTNPTVAKITIAPCATELPDVKNTRSLPPEMLGIAEALADAELENDGAVPTGVVLGVSIHEMETKKGARRQQTVRGLGANVVLKDGGKGMRVPFKDLQLLASFTLDGEVFQKTSQRSYVSWLYLKVQRASKDLTVNPLDTETRVVGESEKGEFVKMEKMTRKERTRMNADRDLATDTALDLVVNAARKVKAQVKARDKASAAMSSDAAILKANGV